MAPAKPLTETALAIAAARALFVDGDAIKAERLANAALRQQPKDAEALFVRMETAGIRADRDTVIETALRLCEVAQGPVADARVQLAARRLSESAENTERFRQAIPRLEALLQNSPNGWPELSSALLGAAMDGAAGLQPAGLARAAGILTDWRVAAPMPHRILCDLDAQLLSSANPLAQSEYGGRMVENFQFPDGRLSLPDYMLKPGTVYAASQFAVLEGENWTIRLESQSAAELYLDGQLALRTQPRQPSGQKSMDLLPGPHRVLLKFASHQGWWRVSANPAMPTLEIKRGVSQAEAAYLKAASSYAAGDWQRAIADASNEPAGNPMLLFLVAQAQSRQAATALQAIESWQKLTLRMPGALAAEEALAMHAAALGNRSEATLRASRVLAAHPRSEAGLRVLAQFAAPPERERYLQQLIDSHPSCEVLVEAHHEYESQHDSSGMAMSDIALNGCAPGSTTYAHLLADVGMHAAAAEALRPVLKEWPSERSAMSMLIRELQLAGDDAGAQQAAADWVRVAPNAGTYRRLAAGLKDAGAAGEPSIDGTPFYGPYRREVPESAKASAKGSSSVLLEDHVALARADGSVSLYIHRATRFGGAETAEQFRREANSPDEELISLRLLKANGTMSDLRSQKSAWNRIAEGDIIDREIVLNFAGDGSIADHPEVFQYVFAASSTQPLTARFVVLTPAAESDSGVVISTGNAPRMQSKVVGGMMARIWEVPAKGVPATGAVVSGDAQESFAVVRVVEKENGWTVPRNAERRKRIETIHPGPKLADG